MRRHTEMRAGEARAAIEAGEVCELLPETGAAWKSGEITGGAARTIAGARVSGHDRELRKIEHVLLRFARDHATRDLQKSCAHFRNCATSDGTSPRELDGLTILRTSAGRAFIGADLSSDGAEIVVTALHALTDPPTEGDDRSPARRRADALVEMARLALASLNGATTDGPARAPPACTVVIDWTTLTASTPPGRLDGGFTGAIHRRDVERMLCDCSVSRVVTGPAGLPIDVGRQTRTVRHHERRALVVRDGGCRFPGCDRPPGWTDAHHVVHWRNGGRTDLANLVLLCSHHHHVVHQPGWIVKFDGRDLRVVAPDGIEIR
ncbi:MAG: DUF222 domain-containing protein [Acidimicrobiia bacterium]